MIQNKRDNAINKGRTIGTWRGSIQFSKTFCSGAPAAHKYACSQAVRAPTVQAQTVCKRTCTTSAATLSCNWCSSAAARLPTSALISRVPSPSTRTKMATSRARFWLFCACVNGGRQGCGWLVEAGVRATAYTWPQAATGSGCSVSVRAGVPGRGGEKCVCGGGVRWRRRWPTAAPRSGCSAGLPIAGKRGTQQSRQTDKRGYAHSTKTMRCAGVCFVRWNQAWA